MSDPSVPSVASDPSVRQEQKSRLFASLRVRMAISHGAVLALILLLLGSIGYLLLAENLDHAATAEVLAAAQTEVDRAIDTGRIPPPPDNDVPSTSAIQAAVFLPHGQALGERPEVPRWLRPQPREIATIRFLGERVRLATLPLVIRGRAFGTVVAGRSLAPEERLLRRVRLLLMLGGLAGIAASVVAGWLLSGRAARPVRRAYEAQAAFAADASHELRTPLTFVRSGVEVLAEHDPALGSDVLHEIGYLTALTERLLQMARSPEAHAAFELRPLDLGVICREAAERSRRALGVEVDLHLSDDVGAVGDPVAVEAALDAVLENVARHGGRHATIGSSLGDGHARVSIADHGPGLPAELRARAFERFFRVDPARSRAEGGAGLGLPLARSLIEAQRGRMWLEETPGGGLTAVIELPARDS